LQSYGSDYIASWVNKILPSAVLTKPTQAPMASGEKLQMYVTQLIQLLGMNYLPIIKQQHVFGLLYYITVLLTYILYYCNNYITWFRFFVWCTMYSNI